MEFRRTKQIKRTQRIVQAVGETAFPEVLILIASKVSNPTAEDVNRYRKQYKITRY